MDKDSLLEETKYARQDFLCLLSWYHEISNQDSRLEELIYRLLAAEKWYQTCLEKLRQEGITQPVTPYSTIGCRRKILCSNCWHGW